MIPVSLLSGYLYCPRKIFLDKKLRLSSPPKNAALKARLRLTLLNKLNNTEEKVVSSINDNLTFERIERLYQRNTSSIITWLIQENRTELRKVRILPEKMHTWLAKSVDSMNMVHARNVYDFMEGKRLYGTELWLELSPKIKSEYRMTSEQLGLTGILDQLHITETGLLPVEQKTGRPPETGVWPGHQMQMAALVSLLEEKFGTELSEGVVIYGDEKREVIINPFMREQVMQTRDKVKTILESNELPKRIMNENKCNACEFRQKCYDEIFMSQRMNNLGSSRSSGQ